MGLNKDVITKFHSPLEYGKRRVLSAIEDHYLEYYYYLRYQLLGHSFSDWFRLKSVQHIKDRPNVELTIRRDPQARYAYTAHEDETTKPYTMPNFVARRVLNSISDDEIKGKIFLDLFGGHGAISFLLAGGWKGVVPKTIITSDIAYNPRKEEKRTRISHDHFYWENLLRPNQLPKSYKEPMYITSSATSIPLPDDSVDTIFADPPFGIKTIIDFSPIVFFNAVLPEIERVLKPGSNVYCLYPDEHLSRIHPPDKLSINCLSHNVGRTNFDIALLQLHKSP